MKYKSGPLAACIKQAADLSGSGEPDERVVFPVRCLLQGKLLTGLYLIPGEATGMTLQRLAEAVSAQGRISPFPLGQQPANLAYDEAGTGMVINERRVVGTLSFAGETEPAVCLYRLDTHTAPME